MTASYTAILLREKDMNLRRAWSATCPDGYLMDAFANAIEHRITQIDNDPLDAYVTVELVEDFVARCDRIFAENNPSNLEEVEKLATEIDTLELYEYIRND